MMERITKRYCKIINCENQCGISDKNVLFFKIPTNAESHKKWMNIIKNHQQIDASVSQFYICELHFHSDVINRQKKRDHLNKDAIPTIFPVRPKPQYSQLVVPIVDSNSTAGPSDPLGRLNIWPVGYTASRKAANSKFTCKRCIEKACDLSTANGKLYDLGLKLRKKTNKVLNIQHEMVARVSRIIPLRIEDPSQDNQNYIPQRTLKKNPVLERIDVDESRASDCQEPMEISADDLDRPNEQTENAVATPNEEESDDDNDDDDDFDPPDCERQQFVTYIMSSISELPEQNAIQAIAAIRLYLKNWPGYAENI